MLNYCLVNTETLIHFILNKIKMYYNVIQYAFGCTVFYNVSFSSIQTTHSYLIPFEKKKSKIL